MILEKFKHIMYKSKAAKSIFDLTFIKKNKHFKNKITQKTNSIQLIFMFLY